MKVYRIIVIVIDIILSISFCIFSFLTPSFQTAIKDPVTEEYYKYLKENTLKVAKTLDTSVLNDETLTADFYFNNDEIVVTVKSIKAKVTAKIPISNQLLNFEDNTIKTQGIAEFENVEYEEEKLLKPVWYYILIAILGSIMVYVCIYIILGSWIPSPKKQ